MCFKLPVNLLFKIKSILFKIKSILHQSITSVINLFVHFCNNKAFLKTGLGLFVIAGLSSVSYAESLFTTTNPSNLSDAQTEPLSQEISSDSINKLENTDNALNYLKKSQEDLSYEQIGSLTQIQSALPYEVLSNDQADHAAASASNTYQADKVFSERAQNNSHEVGYVIASLDRSKLNSSTEAGSVCLENCGETHSRSYLDDLSVLSKACPPFIIQRQLKDDKGSFTTDSPDKICSNRSLSNRFKNPAEFEAYIHQNPFFSDFKDRPVPFSACLSQEVSVDRGWGFISLEGRKKLPVEKHNLALADYYSSLKRLSEGVKRSIKNIAAIDQILGSPVLEDVCNSHEFSPESGFLRSHKAVQRECSLAKVCSSSPSSSSKSWGKGSFSQQNEEVKLALEEARAIDNEIKKLKGSRNSAFHKNKEKIEELEERKQSILRLHPQTFSSFSFSNSSPSPLLSQYSKDTLLALEGIRALDREINSLKGQRGRDIHRNKEKIKELEERKQSLLSLYPWASGKAFKDSYKPSEYASYTNKDSSEEEKKKLEDKMSKLIRRQLVQTRNKLKERRLDFINASHCIEASGIYSGICDNSDMDKILAKAPPLDSSLAFNGERRRALRKKNKENTLTPDERKEYRTLLTKDAPAESLFGYSECLNTQRKAVKEVNKEIALGALDVGIVIGTMGLGSAVVAGRMALRVGGALSKAQKLSKAKRMQNLGVFGADASFSAPYMREALETCGSQLDQLEETVRHTVNEQTASNTNIDTNTNSNTNTKMCDQLSVRAKHTSDLKSCVLQASLASLPITLPILGLTGMAISRSLGKAKALPQASKGVSSQGDKAEEVLKTKLSSEQKKAVEEAHLVGRGEKGKDGSLASIGNYTEAQLKRKAEILKKAGFSQAQIRKLMEEGIVGWRDRKPLGKPPKTPGFFKRAKNKLSARRRRARHGAKKSNKQSNKQSNQALDSNETGLSAGAIKFREAYNQGVFVEGQKYIRIADSSNTEMYPVLRIKSFDGKNLVVEEMAPSGAITERTLSKDELLRASVNMSRDRLRWDDVLPTHEEVMSRMRSRKKTPTHKTKIVLNADGSKSLEGLTGDQIRKLDVTQLTPDQIRQLNVRDLNNGQMQKLDKSHLTAKQIKQVPRSYLDRDFMLDRWKDLTSKQRREVNMSNLTPEQARRIKIKDLTKDQIRQLNIETLTPDQIRQLNVRDLSRDQMKVLDKSHLTSRQIKQVPRSYLDKDFMLDRWKDLTSKQRREVNMSNLTPEQARRIKIKDLTEDQIRQLDIETLTPDQIRQLNVRDLSRDQMQKLDKSHLTAKQIKQVPRSYLDKDFMLDRWKDLTSKQRREVNMSNLTPEQARRIKIKDLTKDQIRQLNIETLAPDQIRQLKIGDLAKWQVDKLNANREHLTSGQIKQLQRYRGR